MLQPLHRHNPITPTRCNPMMAAPSRDWNIFKQIFADHWDGFTHAHPRYQTAYYNDLVSKMLACGNPEKMGYIEYRDRLREPNWRFTLCTARSMPSNNANACYHAVLW